MPVNGNHNHIIIVCLLFGDLAGLTVKSGISVTVTL